MLSLNWSNTLHQQYLLYGGLMLAVILYIDGSSSEQAPICKQIKRRMFCFSKLLPVEFLMFGYMNQICLCCRNNAKYVWVFVCCSLLFFSESGWILFSIVIETPHMPWIRYTDVIQEYKPSLYKNIMNNFQELHLKRLFSNMYHFNIRHLK